MGHNYCWGGGNYITSIQSVRHIQWTPKFCKNPILLPYPKAMNLTPYLFKFHFEINLTSTSWSRKFSVCLKFTTKILYTFFMSRVTATWPVRLNLHDLNTSKMRLMKFLFMQFSPFSCYSSLGYGLEDPGFQFLEVHRL